MIVIILKQRRYAAIAIFSAIGFAVLHYYLSMSMLQEHIGLVSEQIPLYFGASLFLSALVAALAGINVSLVVYKNISSKLLNLKKSSSTFLSTGFAVFTPGCPACTTPLAVLLAAVGGIALFPLQGLELKIISIGALVFAMYWITRGLQQPSCCSMQKN